jgi:mannan endo-1,4-beta-mannosidase
MNRWLVVLVVMLLFTGAVNAQGKGFVTVKNGSFVLDGKPYYYVGANYWYGAILGTKGAYGNSARLLRELDAMKAMGIDNLRVLAGAEGPDDEPFRVTPTLQVAPGLYNDDLFDGLDFLLAEMGKRNMRAVLFLNNSWDWSGGYAQYLNWNGYGPIPYPSVKPNTWPQFIAYSAQFHQCDKCKRQFEEFVSYVIGRTNRYTGLKYIDDPAIMTWEIGNEPRAFSRENIPSLQELIENISALIKSIDPNHLVTTGTEGQHGCEESLEVFERIHSDPNVDYLTMHIWPKNWGWLDVKNIPGSLDSSIIKTNVYMNDHIAIARRLKKPLVLEEFGLPRDMHGYSPSESVTCRDRYYKNAFDQIVTHARKHDVLAGANFWSYSGEGRATPGHLYWEKGDDYLGDPPVEEQGLNSVFNTDKTISLVTSCNKKLKKILK